MNRLERLAQVAVIVMGVIAVFATLDALEGIFAPLLLALVAGIVLSPLSDFWERRGYSGLIGALIGLFVTLAGIGALALVFQPAIAQLIDQAPKVWSDMQETIAMLRGLVRGLSEMTDGVSEAISDAADAGPATGAPAAAAEPVAMPSIADALMVAPAILSQILIFAGTLFFFLLTRTEIYAWVARHLTDRDMTEAQTAHRLRQAERHVSRYFVTITLINAGLGAMTAIALQAMGMPGALLWGIVAFLMNFVVYLGPAIFATALVFAGIGAFDGAMAVMPAAVFVTLNGIEGQFVTPALVGRRMAINPLLAFLSLVFGIWLWGPIGGFVAIPALLWVLVLNDALRETVPDPEAVPQAE